VEACYLEWSFGPRVREFAVGERRVPVTGRIDRIDVGPGGALAIYDYKSGKKAPSAREIKEVADIQLGLYALAAEHLLGAEVAGVWYWQVPSMGRTEGVWKADYHRDFNAGRKAAGKLDR
jgi:RecB family exonuclease